MYVTRFISTILVFWYLFASVSTEDKWQCLNLTEMPPKRYVHYMDVQTTIKVQTSSRTFHRLSTEIFKIFLEEIVGFSEVEILQHGEEFQMDNIVRNLSAHNRPESEVLPSAMIDLEVWVPPGQDLLTWEDTEMVREFGDVGPPGHFGWFIPAEMDAPVQRFYNKWDEHIRQVHWMIFRDEKSVAAFELDAKYMSFVDTNAKLNSTHYLCMEKFCKNGIYSPPQCVHSPCALLLTSSVAATSFVVDHIEQLQLLVKVVWLGDNLGKTVKTLTRQYKSNPSRSAKSLLIMHYTPSDIIIREKYFINVIFPQCDYVNSSISLGCKYELNRMVKMTWHKVDSLGLQQHVRNFKFSEDEYDHLLTLYETAPNQNDLRQIGCQWLKDHNSSWISKHGKTTLYIGGIFPISESAYKGEGIVIGAALAREAINKNTSILHGYDLKVVVNDGRCRPDSVMKIFIDYITNENYDQLVGVLGPACSDTVEPLAGVSKHFRTMVVSYSAEGASFSDRDKYPYFFRTIGENKDFKYVYLQLFQKLKWKRVAALTEDGQKYTEYISHMQEMLEENDITFISNNKFPRERDTFQMTRYLEDLKRKSARIIILDVVDAIARTVMCEASRMKMTSEDGYVWFLPAWLNETWYDTDDFNRRKNESVNCSTFQMIQSIKGYFSMAHQFFANDEERVQGNMTVAEWKIQFAAQANHGRKKVPLSNYAGYAYDAVWTYALALDKLAKSDSKAISNMHSPNTTKEMVKLIEATDFYGVSGRIKFRGGPSRFSNINLMQWYNNETHIVGIFYPNVSDDRPEILGGHLELNRSNLHWFTVNRAQPADGSLPPPTCTFESLAKALNVSCEIAIVILDVIVIFLLCLCVSAGIFFIKRRYDRKMRYTEKYMRHFGIDLRLNPAQISDLDKWEIPRNSVVINRKLGEGAFGTVYGGEANFPEKGWVAVAVKTLKVGSSTEEKLDFLSEAEVMKRFEHKNIIKLLGVCTKDEPIYTIMEFMLYGDLKTFLLARRHLVNDKTIEESDEISSKKLTMMALDVARGLSYLAQLKYVHRDVASRNCLINAQRIVKLGDFGMTRPMFENDYYKFTRKGMLPVRWMSPESLALGVFSPASDVWSYGVLLFEIITFGSFPYQGMTNSEVLDYVKMGNTVTIPDGVRTQLRGLLKSCWHQEPKMRTRASEIVEFLANNPRLLVPCLEMPLASVQLEGTDQLEISLPDQFRKFSTSMGSPSMPNGTTCLDRSDPSVSIPLENCCPQEPLLGPSKSHSSLLNFGKYVTIQHHGDEFALHDEDDDDYLSHDPAPANGFVISKV